MKTLKVILRNVYGKEMIYPGCEASKVFTKMLGTKTFTDFHIACLKELGYEFEVIVQGRSL